MVRLSADVTLTSSPSFKPIFSSSVSGSRATRLSCLEHLHGNLLHRIALLDDTIPWIRVGNATIRVWQPACGRPARCPERTVTGNCDSGRRAALIFAVVETVGDINTIADDDDAMSRLRNYMIFRPNYKIGRGGCRIFPRKTDRSVAPRERACMRRCQPCSDRRELDQLLARRRPRTRASPLRFP